MTAVIECLSALHSPLSRAAIVTSEQGQQAGNQSAEVLHTMVNRDYCSVKNRRFNSSSNKRFERVSFHKIPPQSYLKTIWERFIRRRKPRNYTVGEIHSENLVFVCEYSFSLFLCSCFPGFVGV